LAPNIELQDLDIGFQKVGELSCWSIEGPCRGERDKWKVVGRNRVVEREGPIHRVRNAVNMKGKTAPVAKTPIVTDPFLGIDD
jgi:hypothetical protein